MCKLTVLSVEDEPTTITALVEDLASASIEVQYAADLSRAESDVQARCFDLLLIDLRMHRGSLFLEYGGLQFLRDVRSGSFGDHNARTPAAILTAYEYQLRSEELTGLEPFLGVYSKLSSPADLFVAWSALNSSVGSVWRSSHPDWIVEDLVSFNSPERDGGWFEVEIPSFEGDEKILVEADALPDDLRQELAWPERPVFAWARYDITARSPDAVRAHDFRLFTEGDRAHGSFDWDPTGLGRGGPNRREQQEDQTQ